jgi:hypothetical protein
MSLQPIKIKSKKSIGIQPVYDISVPDAQHYILDSGVVSHNSGFIYASSIVCAMRKLKLKEDEDGNKTTDVKGIRAQIKVMKTRYNKPFEQVELKIPYEQGMDEYSGLVDLFEQKELLVKEGNKLKYIGLDGTEVKKFRKQIDHDLLDLIMKEFPEHLERREAARIAALRAESDADLENYNANEHDEEGYE